GVAASNESFSRVNGVLRIEHRLTLGNLADQSLARFSKGDDRRSEAAPGTVDDDGGLSALHHGDHRICGSEVYPYCLCHINSSSFFKIFLRLSAAGSSPFRLPETAPLHRSAISSTSATVRFPLQTRWTSLSISSSSFNYPCFVTDQVKQATAMFPRRRGYATGDKNCE